MKRLLETDGSFSSMLNPYRDKFMKSLKSKLQSMRKMVRSVMKKNAILKVLSIPALSTAESSGPKKVKQLTLKSLVNRTVPIELVLRLVVENNLT